MKDNLTFPADDVILAISKALNLSRPTNPYHHLQVGYLSHLLASEIGLSQKEKENLFIASLIHDACLLSGERERLLVIEQPANPIIHRHPLIAYLILRDFPYIKDIFPDVPRIILYHHFKNEDIANPKEGSLLLKIVKHFGEEIPLASLILHLANDVSLMINPYQFILHQRDGIMEKIKGRKGNFFPSSIVEAFQEIARKEYIWLNLVSPLIEDYIRELFPLRGAEIKGDELLNLAILFANFVDFKSHFTAVHSRGVGRVAEALAELCSLPEEDVRLMRIAGKFHDLGKLAVPVEILDKNGKLSPDELAIILAHPFYTYSVLSKIKGFEKAKEWAGLHHERLDGSGYPFHFKGEELSLEARIMAVADVFSALREKRPYRSVLGKGDIVRIMEKEAKDGKLDPEIVSLLLKHYEEVDARFLEIEFSALRKHSQLWQEISSIFAQFLVS